MLNLRPPMLSFFTRTAQFFGCLPQAEHEGAPLLINGVQPNNLPEQQQKRVLLNFSKTPLAQILKPEYLRESDIEGGGDARFSEIYNAAVNLYKTTFGLRADEPLTDIHAQHLTDYLCGENEWEPNQASRALDENQVSRQGAFTFRLKMVGGLMLMGTAATAAYGAYRAISYAHAYDSRVPDCDGQTYPSPPPPPISANLRLCYSCGS